MARCEVCGNDYYLSFEVVAAGKTHTFDSFECAIHKLAPGVRALPVQDHRSRHRGQKNVLLLRPLRPRGRRQGGGRPRLNPEARASILVGRL